MCVFMGVHVCTCVSNFNCLEEGRELKKPMEGEDLHVSEMIKHFSACH